MDVSDVQLDFSKKAVLRPEASMDEMNAKSIKAKYINSRKGK